MFTGLVETMGEVAGARPSRAGMRLVVAHDPWDEPARAGDSIAVEGVCLTAVEVEARAFAADVIGETLTRSTLSRLRVGDRVNLERALRLGERLGGHLVQGHVDGVAEVVSVERRPADTRLRCRIPPELARYVAEKGSIALAGVSLTVAGVGRAGVEVALIPETLARTTLGTVRPGDRLNVEVDLLARYLDRLLEGRAPQRFPGPA